MKLNREAMKAAAEAARRYPKGRALNLITTLDEEVIEFNHAAKRLAEQRELVRYG